MVAATFLVSWRVWSPAKIYDRGKSQHHCGLERKTMMTLSVCFTSGWDRSLSFKDYKPMHIRPLPLTCIKNVQFTSETYNLWGDFLLLLVEFSFHKQAKSVQEEFLRRMKTWKGGSLFSSLCCIALLAISSWTDTLGFTSGAYHVVIALNQWSVRCSVILGLSTHGRTPKSEMTATGNRLRFTSLHAVF